MASITKAAATTAGARGGRGRRRIEEGEEGEEEEEEEKEEGEEGGGGEPTWIANASHQDYLLLLLLSYSPLPASTFFSYVFFLFHILLSIP